MIEHVCNHTLPAAYSLLPPSLNSPEASAMILAIGWQESKFQFRRQIGGPARGFWQFEENGVLAVLSHPDTKILAQKVLSALCYNPFPTPVGCHYSLEHNDVLACVFARLLLWAIPHPLPVTPDDGWRQYLMGWRPGKPRPDTWGKAWEIGMMK